MEAPRTQQKLQRSTAIAVASQLQRWRFLKLEGVATAIAVKSQLQLWRFLHPEGLSTAIAVDLQLQPFFDHHENTEDSRVYAGLKIHPFFSLWKVEKKNQEEECSLIPTKREGRGVTCDSIHVFENVQDDVSPLDWSGWTFLNDTTTAEFGPTSLNLCFVESLNFDNFPDALKSSSTSISQNVMSCSDQLFKQSDNMLEISLTNSAGLANERAICPSKLEGVKDDVSPLDWSGWTFLNDTTTTAEFGPPSLNLCFVESLNFDNFPDVKSSSASISQNVMSCSDQLSKQSDNMLEISLTNSAGLANEQAICPSKLEGYRRVFYQGSTDHRGTPEFPGRTVTLEPAEGEICHLEVREKQYDKREYLDFYTDPNATSPAVTGVLVYIATSDKKSNVNYLGPASVEEIARQIVEAKGPAGPNRDYLFILEKALLQIGCKDQHVIDLANEVRRILAEEH
uniref:glutathione-specific gamma-glutamylcyclotransferase n=1 Tax=Cajanus cajan TaxID=3821 RepID=A0A151TWM3_CAJCA|nr:Cation transport regulator-like protein 2 [Cajanus cajan]